MLVVAGGLMRVGVFTGAAEAGRTRHVSWSSLVALAGAALALLAGWIAVNL